MQRASNIHRLSELHCHQEPEFSHRGRRVIWCTVVRFSRFYLQPYFPEVQFAFLMAGPLGRQGWRGGSVLFHPVQTACTSAGVNQVKGTPLSQPYHVSHHSWKPARQPAVVRWVFHYFCCTVCCSYSSANVWCCCVMAQMLRDVFFWHHRHCADGSWRGTICKLSLISQTEESTMGYLYSKLSLPPFSFLKAQKRSRQKFDQFFSNKNYAGTGYLGLLGKKLWPDCWWRLWWLFM